MRFRKLRIAISIVCGVVCLLLSAACFAFQYPRTSAELMHRSGPGPTAVDIYDGNLSLSWQPRVPCRPAWAGQINRHGFRCSVYSSGSWHVLAPLWVIGAALAAAVAPLAASPWLSWRFSLRTLLVATTLFALVLGLIMLLSQR